MSSPDAVQMVVTLKPLDIKEAGVIKKRSPGVQLFSIASRKLLSITTPMYRPRLLPAGILGV
jgi:hypothetical protein